MLRIIYPNRWFLYTVAFIIAVFLILIWQISLYNIEQDFAFGDNEISYTIHLLKKQNAHSSIPLTASNNFDISKWKTYRDEKYGFEFKYPTGWIELAASDYFASNRVITFGQQSRYPESMRNQWPCGHGASCLPPDYLTLDVYVKDGTFLKNRADRIATKAVVYDHTIYKMNNCPEFCDDAFVEIGGDTFLHFVLTREHESETEGIKEFNQILSTLEFFEPKNGALP